MNVLSRIVAEKTGYIPFADALKKMEARFPLLVADIGWQKVSRMDEAEAVRAEWMLTPDEEEA